MSSCINVLSIGFIITLIITWVEIIVFQYIKLQKSFVNRCG